MKCGGWLELIELNWTLTLIVTDSIISFIVARVCVRAYKKSLLKANKPTSFIFSFVCMRKHRKAHRVYSNFRSPLILYSPKFYYKIAVAPNFLFYPSLSFQPPAAGLLIKRDVAKNVKGRLVKNNFRKFKTPTSMKSSFFYRTLEIFQTAFR